MVLPADDCDDCIPEYMRRRSSVASTAVIFSALPFLVSFLFIATIVFQRLFPLLSGSVPLNNDQRSSKLPSPFNLRKLSTSRTSHPSLATSIKRLSAFAFSTTISLAAVLAELVLCEISNAINPITRGIALQVTIFLLLVLLIIVIPSLEIHSLITAAGWSYTGTRRSRLRFAWVLHVLAFSIWILGFWATGQLLLTKHHEEKGINNHERFIDAVIEHVGVIGISFMALLSGFASVSAPWQSFGARSKPVSESMIERKEAGLEATNDMLAAKKSRLRALEHKVSDSPQEGFFQRAMGSIRGNTDQVEKKNLELEIAGLENMALSLSTHRSLLHSRLYQQRQARTPTGRAFLIASCLFSVYCLYRIIATSITLIRRRLSSPENPFTGSDPINNILAVFVNHYDPNLDRDAWTRQISFLLSGVMLFASFSSVLQTFHFFARFAPSLLKAAQANLALIVAQTCATYVISAALLLRGIIPGQVVSDHLKGLGGSELEWVDGWFEVWFLGGVLVTGVGIWIGRSIGNGVDGWDDDPDDMEMGKTS
ncbi:MAG: hypothetical protein MMC33_000869 [Icmadophila ericetorum]|nr:hypothetical protein [Icmadophila ericetorum]